MTISIGINVASEHDLKAINAVLPTGECLIWLKSGCVIESYRSRKPDIF